MKRRSAPPYGPMRLGKTLVFYSLNSYAYQMDVPPVELFGVTFLIDLQLCVTARF